MREVFVDTDILINFLRGREGAKNFLSSLINDSIIYCSVISVAEIFVGMKDHEKEKTNELLDSLNIVDVTREIAEKAGEYKKQEKKQLLELDDCLIAATVFIKRAVLATGNEKHYPMTDVKKIIVRA